MSEKRIWEWENSGLSDNLPSILKHYNADLKSLTIDDEFGAERFEQTTKMFASVMNSLIDAIDMGKVPVPHGFEKPVILKTIRELERTANAIKGRNVEGVNQLNAQCKSIYKQYAEDESF